MEPIYFIKIPNASKCSALYFNENKLCNLNIGSNIVNISDIYKEIWRKDAINLRYHNNPITVPDPDAVLTAAEIMFLVIASRQYNWIKWDHLQHDPPEYICTSRSNFNVKTTSRDIDFN